MKFTFKTTKPSGYGRYNIFYSIRHEIKLKKKLVGYIEDKSPHKIGLMVVKNDIMEDGNPNCSWKWITLKKESASLDDAKIWLNNNIELITKKYNLHLSE